MSIGCSLLQANRQPVNQILTTVFRVFAVFVPGIRDRSRLLDRAKLNWPRGQSLFGACIFRKLLGVYPELTDGHIKVVANRCHHVARSVGKTSLYSSQIIGAITQRCRQSGLGELSYRSHLRDRTTKYLIRRFRFSFYIGSDRLGHPVIVEDQTETKQQL